MGISRGCIDQCQQVLIAGWAVTDGAPGVVDIYVNEAHIGYAEATAKRPDVAIAIEGAPELCGFTFRLPRALRASDRVDVYLRTASSGRQIRLTGGQHEERTARLTCGVMKSHRGLEVGALDKPLLDRQHYHVSFVDHASREDLIEKYRRSGSPETFNPATVEEVDIVWPPGQRLADIIAPDRFDYICACQVIEHIADPIGWLNDLAECLVPGGRINLSIPDKRYTFDHCRSLSTVSDVVDAHRRKLLLPSFRQVFDHILHVAMPGSVPDFLNLANAYEVAKLAEAGTYVDVHCHVWTKDSFVDCWHIIKRLGLSPLKMDQAWDPIVGANEFIVSFVKS